MEIYVWIDRLNLQSKPKKHFARDFSDGVLCAEILMKTTCSSSSSSFSRRSNTARMISMHNYPIKNSFKGKLENWELLNAKVLRSPKIRCELTREEMSAVARSEKDAAERVLLKIKTAVEDDFMSLDHPDERDGDREEEEEEEESKSETDEYEIEEEEEEEEEEQEQNTHKQRLAQSSANDEKNDDEKEKEDKEETKTTTTTTKLLSLKEATIKEEEEEEKNHPRKSSLLSSSLIKEKDEAISRLTVKVDALTAKCAKLEQLLELTKRKAIL